MVHEGDLTITENDAVVEDLEIRGSLFISGAQNVTVRNVWVYSRSFWTVFVDGGATVVFEHVEIGHPDFIGERGIGGQNVVGRYLDIHHVEDGIKLSSNNVYLNVWVHDLDSENPEPHADAIQIDGPASGAIIRDSVLDSTGPLGFGNAALQLGSDLGPVDDILFERNLLNGGNYTIFLDDAGHGLPSNVRFINNRFGRDFNYGIAAFDGPAEAEGNVWDDTGEPLDLNAEANEPTATPASSPPTSPSTTSPASTSTATTPETTSVGTVALAVEEPEGNNSIPAIIGVILGLLVGALATVGMTRIRDRRQAGG